MNTGNESRRKPADKLLPPASFLVARGLAWTVAALVVAAVTWCTQVEVQIVVSAAGKLVVRGESIQKSAPEQGTVVEIPVEVGQAIRKGDLLIRLDSFHHQSEAKMLELELPPL